MENEQSKDREVVFCFLTREELFCDLHEVVVVGVGHVELTRCELRIVSQVNTWSET